MAASDTTGYATAVSLTGRGFFNPLRNHDIRRPPLSLSFREYPVRTMFTSSKTWQVSAVKPMNGTFSIIFHWRTMRDPMNKTNEYVESPYSSLLILSGSHWHCATAGNRCSLLNVMTNKQNTAKKVLKLKGSLQNRASERATWTTTETAFLFFFYMKGSNTKMGKYVLNSVLKLLIVLNKIKSLEPKVKGPSYIQIFMRTSAIRVWGRIIMCRVFQGTSVIIFLQKLRIAWKKTWYRITTCHGIYFMRNVAVVMIWWVMGFA